MSAQAFLVPYDLDRLRSGTGAGPEALIAAGVLDGLHVDSTATIEMGDDSASQVQHCMVVDGALAVVVRHARSTGHVPIVFAGNCHTCLGTLSGLDTAVTIAWFDAHGDLNTPDITQTGYFDGMALATAMGLGWKSMAGLIPGFRAASDTDVMLIGGRDLDPAERTLLEQSRITHHLPDALAGTTSREFGLALDQRSRRRGVYVHLDLDVLDPSQLHANRFNVPGGVSVAWLADALTKVRQRYDVAAVNVTAYDPSFTPPAKAAAIVNRLLRALLHTAP